MMEGMKKRKDVRPRTKQPKIDSTCSRCGSIPKCCAVGCNLPTTGGFSHRELLCLCKRHVNQLFYDKQENRIDIRRPIQFVFNSKTWDMSARRLVNKVIEIRKNNVWTSIDAMGIYMKKNGEVIDSFSESLRVVWMESLREGSTDSNDSCDSLLYFTDNDSINDFVDEFRVVTDSVMLYMSNERWVKCTAEDGTVDVFDVEIKKKKKSSSDSSTTDDSEDDSQLKVYWGWTGDGLPQESFQPIIRNEKPIIVASFRHYGCWTSQTNSFLDESYPLNAFEYHIIQFGTYEHTVKKIYSRVEYFDSDGLFSKPIVPKCQKKYLSR